MEKLHDSVFSIVKTTNLSPAVFSFLQPNDEFGDRTPLGGILKDTKHGWLALGPKFCVIDLRTGLKIAARTFGTTLSNNSVVTSVVELPTPLTQNSKQLLISLQCDNISIICILHVNGSQILRCIQTDIVVSQLAICDRMPDGPFACFDGAVMAGTKSGEIFVFDLNRASLIQALKDISQGYEHLILNENNPTNLSFLPLNSINQVEEQRELALENDHHLAVLLNETSFIDGQYIFRNPDGSIRMKAKRDHIRVTVLDYVPQLGSLAVGFNFGAFQIWNLMNLELQFTSQVNVECLPVTHFGFQEPCDDPRAFCYLWVVFSVIDSCEEDEFPLAVMYSLTYQGKRMLSDTECLYEDFLNATIRFQIELSAVDDVPFLGGKCISCNTYSIHSALGVEGEDSMLNICQLVWECWGENSVNGMDYGMLLFDLDQWYKDQMPATYRVESNAFMSCAGWRGATRALHVRLAPASLAVYSHATRLEEHFYPNSLQYNCICLNTSEVCVLSTRGIQRQIVSNIEEIGPRVLLNPPLLYRACVSCGLTPLYTDTYSSNVTVEDQRRYLLSVALEARLSRFLARCAQDWAGGTHGGAGCTLAFLVDWCWGRAIELKENAKELTQPLFVSTATPDRNVVRCLEHCVQQLTQLTGLMDAILTKCCNLVVPDALSEMEERHKGIATVSLYFQVVQWFLRVGLLPERHDGLHALVYPSDQLLDTYNKRRLKLNRLQENSSLEDNNGQSKSCSLLYIDQLIEHEFGGDRIHQMWARGGGARGGLYPPASLGALLRLYLLPDVADQHKHSLVLYLLVDYSMLYDDARYEAVIRRLMQFPTMFGLSNTAIKATQAFWHLDHRDFDFALDQLQCLSGKTLSAWQHGVLLASLLAQHKTQAALQYLHVRRPAPRPSGDTTSNVSDGHKLEEWQACCKLYLARGLVAEALDVVRGCARAAPSAREHALVLQAFYKGCRNTGNLSKVLQVTLQPFEEEVFIKYLEDCNEPQTSDILVMYFLQQARYLEAERYNEKLKTCHRPDLGRSLESLTAGAEACERQLARDYLVKAAVAALPQIASDVARAATFHTDVETNVIAPKPMSVYVRAKSPKNTFTYKSSFIQDTIENASETWVNRPKMRKGLKRALQIEETPFICTPKLNRSRGVFGEQMQSESTPPKRAKLDFAGTPKTPAMGSSFKVSEKLSSQMEKLLDMPDVHTPVRLYMERSDTPHSILKIRHGSVEPPAPASPASRASPDASPAASRASPAPSDDETLDTASNHTHYSDSTNKHLRFTIPTASESDSTPSPPPTASVKETERTNPTGEKEMDVSISTDSFATTTSHGMYDAHPLESPPKKLATEENIKSRKSYKDNVRARRSLSISANSSLSEDPNASIESIADIPITLINPRYSGEVKSDDTTDLTQTERDRNSISTERESAYVSYSGQAMGGRERSVSYTGRFVGGKEKGEAGGVGGRERDSSSVERLEVPRSPSSRRGIRSLGESTPLGSRSGSGTPERLDSPIVTPSRSSRLSRSRSKTPELSPRSSPLAPILEQPRQEERTEGESQLQTKTLHVPRLLRSRSHTPERLDKGVSESPRLEAIKESPTKDSGPSSPETPRLRSRSRTPEVEVVLEPAKSSPRLRARSKTPEKLMSPKKEHSIRGKKSLSRIVLEANTFAKTKQVAEVEKDTENTTDESESAIECTPKKILKQVPSLMDVTLSPIVNKSVLQASNESVLSETIIEKDNEDLGLKTLPAFTTLHEAEFKSVLHSYQSSIGDSTESIQETKEESNIVEMKSLPGFTTLNEDFNQSVLKSFVSSVAESTQSMNESNNFKGTTSNVSLPKPFAAFSSMIDADFNKSVLKSHQSSVASEKSSLITNDSDEEMTGDNEKADGNVQAEDNRMTERNEMAAQREKERIVEIVREINEIEDMSNASERSNDSNESVDEDDEDSEDSDENSSEEASAGASEEEVDENEVISIGDSDSESQIEEEESGESNHQMDFVSAQNEEIEENNQLTGLTNVQADPLNRASLLTDDNSDHEMSLNYSDENIKLQEAENKQEYEEPAQSQIEVKSTKVTSIEEFLNINSGKNVSDSNKQQTVKNNEQLMEVDVNLPGTSKINTTEKVKVDKSKDVEKPAVEVEKSKSVEVSNTMAKQQELPNINKSKLVEEDKPMKFKEPVLTKVDEPKPAKSEKPTAAKVEEPKPAKDDKQVAAKVEKPKPSKDDKQVAAKVEEPKPSKDDKQVAAKVEEPKPSKDDKQVAAKVEEPKSAIVDESNPGKVGEPKSAKVVEPKSVKAEEPKPAKAMPPVKTIGKDTPKVEEPVTKVSDEAPISDDTKAQTQKMETEETGNEKEKPSETLTPGVRTRKRTASNTSTKSKESEAPKELESPKTPTTRKRTQSNASTKSEEPTPEGTPKRRGKTPELRKIITRRVSREMSQLDESNRSIDETIITTPKRTRNRKVTDDKNDDNDSVASSSSPKTRGRKAAQNDDVESVASESSFVSNKSVVSDSSEKPRKGRKSVVATKPDLSVIPEVLAEESKQETTQDLLNEYSMSRRLTRHQKAVLSTLLESTPRKTGASVTSRTSRTSKSSVASEMDADDDEVQPAFDVQPIDRISLLNKTDFDGPPDVDEVPNTSPESIASDASKMARNRLARASSETKTVPRAAKINRRNMSVDVVEASGSPAGSADRPARGRRASFNRACEALTPKSRRPSTDAKRSEAGSPGPVGSPVSDASGATTPARAARRGRRASTQSNTSARSDAGGRSKKMPVLEEVKEQK